MYTGLAAQGLILVLLRPYIYIYSFKHILSEIIYVTEIDDI